jgi:hypothetical protein
VLILIEELSMSPSSNLDDIRRSALDLADRSERRWKRALILFAAVEGVGWIGFVLLAYHGFSVAVLLGVAVLILYTMIFTWAVALKEHMDNCTQRVLKAIDTLAQARRERPD